MTSSQFIQIVKLGKLNATELKTTKDALGLPNDATLEQVAREISRLHDKYSR